MIYFIKEPEHTGIAVIQTVMYLQTVNVVNVTNIISG